MWFQLEYFPWTGFSIYYHFTHTGEADEPELAEFTTKSRWLILICLFSLVINEEVASRKVSFNKAMIPFAKGLEMTTSSDSAEAQSH